MQNESCHLLSNSGSYQLDEKCPILHPQLYIILPVAVAFLGVFHVFSPYSTYRLAPLILNGAHCPSHESRATGSRAGPNNKTRCCEFLSPLELTCRPITAVSTMVSTAISHRLLMLGPLGKPSGRCWCWAQAACGQRSCVHCVHCMHCARRRCSLRRWGIHLRRKIGAVHCSLDLLVDGVFGLWSCTARSDYELKVDAQSTVAPVEDPPARPRNSAWGCGSHALEAAGSRHPPAAARWQAD